MRAVADDLGDIWSKKNEVVQLIDIIKALNEKKPILKPLKFSSLYKLNSININSIMNPVPFSEILFIDICESWNWPTRNKTNP